MSDVHQDLMDVAYDRWKANDLTKDQFKESLSDIEKLAVFTGNLNYQVCNGGFFQWYDNGYVSDSQELLTALSSYQTQPYIKQVIQLVEEALEIIEDCGGSLNKTSCWDYDDDNDDFDREYMYKRLNELDTQFYAINDKFMQTMEQILTELTQKTA